MDRKEFIMELLDRKPVRCSKCREKLFYIGGGQYECKACGNIELDDFGKVKDFLDKYGPNPSIIISEGTGVPVRIIDQMLREGKVEIVQDSKFFISCENCGCAIRFGRYCPSCATRILGDLKAAFSPDTGEKPKAKPVTKARMRFMNT